MSEFDSLIEEFFSYWWRENPTHATAVGVHVHDGDLERHGADARAERARHYRDFLRAFERHTPEGTGQAIDRTLVVDRLRWELRELEDVRSHERNPALYLEGPLTALYLMAVRDYAPGAERAHRAAERLAALPRVLDEARESLTAASPVLCRTAAEMARSGLGLIEGALPLSLGQAVEDDPSEFRRWDNAVRTAESALRDYANWVEEELRPSADAEFALGREAYDAKLRCLHGLSESADDLFAFGERLKRETEAELDAVAAEIDGPDDWRALMDRLKDDHPDAGGLIDAYAEAVDRARAFLADRGLVRVPRDETLEVTATPEFLRPLIPYAAYQPPAVHEPGAEGIFFVTPPAPEIADRALRDHSRHGIAVTAVHEAYPGHHLQLVRARDAEGEPRRIFWTPLFAEGWALYCEELMWEQGFYRDPRQRLVQLKNLLWRACRVMVDVGLHTRGWTPERAVDYMVAEAGLERPNAEVEVRRYCGDSTQPMSYAVGRREILNLRERYRERRGDRYDLRGFHDRLLAWGTIPTSLVARGMGLDGD